MKVQLNFRFTSLSLSFLAAAMLLLPSTAKAADLSIVQTGPASATAGTTVTYTLHSATNGPYTLPNGVVTTVTYTAAPLFTAVSASGPTWSCGPAISNVVTCTRSLAIGANTAYPDITVTATASAAGAFQNCAHIKFDPNPTTQPDQNPANDTKCINGEIAPGKQANVTATKTCAVKGQAVQCTITITNNTPGVPSAAPISVTDTLTGAISTGQYTGASGTLSPLNCSPGAGAIVPVTCTSPTPVSYGSPQTVVFSYLFPTGAQIKNCATITVGKAGVANPPITACSGGVIVDKPTTAPDLQVTKRCSVSAQTVLCTVMLKNVGTATATGPIGLSDTVTGAPADGKYTGVNSTLASSNCFPPVTSPIPPISCLSSASIPPGSVGEFQFTFVLPKGGIFKNCATSTLPADSNPSNNTNICVSVTVQAPAQNTNGKQ